MRHLPEIFELRTLGDTILIGPRASFGRGHRLAAGSDEAVRRRLTQARVDPGALDRLRRAYERWRAGESYAYLSDAALIARITADARGGRLAAYLVPNAEQRYWRRPDPARAAIRLRGFQPGAPLAEADLPARRPMTRALAPPSTAAIPSGFAARPAGPPPNVGALPIEHRLVDILHRAARSSRLGGDAARQLEAMLAPDLLPTSVGTLAVWAEAGPFGMGSVIDAVLRAKGHAITPVAAFTAVRELDDALRFARQARDENDLDLSAEHLAAVIVALGASVFRDVLRRGATLPKGASGRARVGETFDRRDKDRA